MYYEKKSATKNPEFSLKVPAVIGACSAIVAESRQFFAIHHVKFRSKNITEKIPLW